MDFDRSVTETVVSGLRDGRAWVRDNPGLSVGIVVGSVMVLFLLTAAVTYGVGGGENDGAPEPPGGSLPETPGGGNGSDESSGENGTEQAALVVPCSAADGGQLEFDVNGTAAEPYEIDSAVELACLENSGSLLDGVVHLTADIDVSQLDGEWSAIGDESASFGGTFVGNGHAITGASGPLFDAIREGGSVSSLTVVNSETTGRVDDATETVAVESARAVPTGAVARISAGEIRNVSVVGGDIRGADSAGGVVGVTQGTASLSDVRVQETTVDGGERAGGFVGQVSGGAGVRDSRVTGATVTSEGIAGGASATTQAQVANVTVAETTVSAANRAGGGVGIADSGSVAGVTIVSVDVEAESSGGAIASVRTDVSEIAVRDTVSSGEAAVGGAFGSVAESSTVGELTVTDTTVSGTERVGGVAGEVSGEISQAHVSGTSVAGETAIGGIAGVATGTIDAVDVIGEQVSGTETVGGAVGQLTGTVEATVVDVSRVQGEIRVGGIAGETGGSITTSVVMTDVVGERFVGSVAGATGIGSSIANVATGGSVDARSTAGGLVGGHGVDSEIAQAVTTVSVATSGERSSVGFLFGRAAGDVADETVLYTEKTDTAGVSAIGGGSRKGEAAGTEVSQAAVTDASARGTEFGLGADWAGTAETSLPIVPREVADRVSALPDE